MGQTELVEQAAIKGSRDLKMVVGFVLGKGERVGEGGGETRIARNKGENLEGGLGEVLTSSPCHPPSRYYSLAENLGFDHPVGPLI